MLILGSGYDSSPTGGQRCCALHAQAVCHGLSLRPELIGGHVSGRPVEAGGVLRRPHRSRLTTTNHRRDHANGLLPSTSIRPDSLRGVIEVPTAGDDHLGVSQIMTGSPQVTRA